MTGTHAHPVSPARGTVLLAEDHGEMRALLADVLRHDGYEVREASNGLDLLSLIASELDDGPLRRPSLVLSDIRMPGASGLQVLAELRMLNQSMPVVLITAFGHPETHLEATRLGAQMVLDKPLNLARLRVVVRALIGA